MKKLQKLLLILLTLTISLLALLGIVACDNRQVPVYQGMTISKSARSYTSLSYTASPVSHHDNDNHYGNGKPYDGDYNGKHDDIDTENPFDGADIEDAADSLVVEGSQAALYYANAHQDIYVTVRIHNPDNFEILSFTLNGQKYSNYMFEQGSNMENLILKVNVGAQEGIVDYTIDAIKYIDGTAIKDVRMDGEKTVKVGVHTPNQLPLEVSGETIGYNDVAFSATITDNHGLIAYSNGTIKAIVYDGETVVEQKAVSLGTNTLRFDGLKTGTVYQYAIVADYDNLDGTGFKAHVLYKQAFTTKSIVCFDAVNVTASGISFVYLWDESWQNKTLTSVVLTKNGETLQTLTQTDLLIDGLLSNNEYVIKATYANGETSEEITLSFVTLSNAIPTIEVAIDNVVNTITQSADSVSFTVTETDESNVGAITNIELIPENGETVTLTDLTARTFSSLQENSKYTVKITYVYDLNDGNGEQTIYAESSAYTNLSDKSIIYELQGDIYCVTGVTNKNIQSAVIVSNVAGIPVTKVASYAFKQCKILKTVELPETVTMIGGYTFSECISLTTINLENVTEIYDGTFDGCEKLENICIDKVTKLYPYVFSRCSSLTEIDIPNYITEIPSAAFMYCYSLQKLNLSENVIIIGASAFAGCAFETFTLPKNLVRLGGKAFSGCTNLRSIEIPHGVTTIEEETFYECTSLANIKLHDDIISIRDLAFKDCAIENIKLPSNLQLIHGEAFRGCKNLKELNLPKDIVVEGAFSVDGCESLIDITIPDTVSSVAFSSFAGCKNIKSITIPEGVTKIETWTFNGCVRLESVTLPDSLMSIEHGAFVGCVSLTNIVIPKNVTYLDKDAFDNCLNLVEVVNKSPWITIEKGENANYSIGYYALAIYNSNDTFTSKLTNDNGYIVYTDENEKILVAYQGTATALTIPSYITKINRYALYYFNGLESVDFGNTNWYYTDSYDDWKNQTNGTLLDLTDTALNVTLLTETYTTYYWYKL